MNKAELAKVLRRRGNAIIESGDYSSDRTDDAELFLVLAHLLEGLSAIDSAMRRRSPAFLVRARRRGSGPGGENTCEVRR